MNSWLCVPVEISNNTTESFTKTSKTSFNFVNHNFVVV